MSPIHAVDQLRRATETLLGRGRRDAVDPAFSARPPASPPSPSPSAGPRHGKELAARSTQGVDTDQGEAIFND